MTTDALPLIPLLPAFKGPVYTRNGTELYAAHAYQYATTSEPAGNKMAPAFVVLVADDDDIVLAINYARQNKVGIAVRSGGHHYIGSSSTDGNNIQIDLSGREAPGYRAEKRGDHKGMQSPPGTYPYRQWLIDDHEGSIKLGAGLCVDDVNDICVDHNIFFPHGECCGVHVGGHSQTGGFSVISRTFGIMIDYLLSFDIILADGTKRTVKRPPPLDGRSGETDALDLNDELWWAVLGGSPGNFGVVTSITVQYFKDEDYPKTRGFKAAWLFRAETLKKLVQVLNEINDDDKIGPDFALSVMALGAEYDEDTRGWSFLPKTFDDTMAEKYPKLVEPAKFHWIFPTIVVYGAWTNFGGKDQDDSGVDAVFERFRQVEGMVDDKVIDDFFPTDDMLKSDKHTPMSKIMQSLTFENPREFNMSCKKMAWFGKNTNTMSQPLPQLDNRTFAEWLGDKVYELERIMRPGCFPRLNRKFWGTKAAIQVGFLGGPGLANPPRPTALAHRDCNYWFAFDVFYDPKVDKAKKRAIEFTNSIADDVMPPANKANLWDDDRERRLILGPMLVHDEHPVLDDMRQLYFDDEDTYNRLLSIKKTVDPDNIFTPNLFCVGATSCPRFAP